MDNYIVKLSLKAESDYINIISYIQNSLMEPDIAKKYAILIKDEISNLEFSPQKFSIVDTSIVKHKNIRKLIIKNYIVFYRINEEKKIVTVERILYGGTNWKNLL